MMILYAAYKSKRSIELLQKENKSKLMRHRHRRKGKRKITPSPDFLRKAKCASYRQNHSSRSMLYTCLYPFSKLKARKAFSPFFEGHQKIPLSKNF